MTSHGDRLPQDLKLEVATDELKDLRKRLSGAEGEHAEALDLIRAMLSDVETALKDTEKEAWEFDREVVVRGESKATGRVDVTAVSRWMEDRNKKLRTSLSKLRLRTTAMRKKLAAAEKRASDQDEGAEKLHDIDFHS